MIELIELTELKNKLSSIIAEKHRIDNLIDIILFKSKINEEMKPEDQYKLDNLNKKMDELLVEEEEIKERIEQLKGQ